MEHVDRAFVAVDFQCICSWKLQHDTDMYIINERC